jgi:quinoprotein glucose dehydrogenase
LTVPWEIAFLNGDRALVTERPGRVRLIENGTLVSEPYFEVNARQGGEGGLLGLAIHPENPTQPFIYVMFTYSRSGEIFNKVERYRDTGNSAVFDRIILDGIPGSRNHNGGRIAFGPDGMLYITTGEIFRAELAQNVRSLAGKILRVTADGQIPESNPFPDSPVYSYGHRNPQGLAWHPETGDLFASEHGPSGEFGLRGHDIVNVIRRGRNYGWPRAVGQVNMEEYEDPLVMWVRATPPAGMAFWENQLHVASLRSESLIRIGVEQESGGYGVASIERLFTDPSAGGRFGRLRAVVAGPDGALYVTTSNRDGRGRARAGDDKILRITLR